MPAAEFIPKQLSSATSRGTKRRGFSSHDLIICGAEHCQQRSGKRYDVWKPRGDPKTSLVHHAPSARADLIRNGGPLSPESPLNLSFYSRESGEDKPCSSGDLPICHAGPMEARAIGKGVHTNVNTAERGSLGTIAVYNGAVTSQTPQPSLGTSTP